jgi:hypothetical protein
MGGYNFARELRNGVRADDKKHVVTLNEYEMALIELVTRDKLRVEEMRGIVHRVSDFEKRRDGFAAELAFCKLFNVYRDFGTQYTGYDVVIGDEMKTVDVKQTSYNDGKLTADIRGKIFDLYVLMVGQFPRFVYRGSILREMLFRPENIETIGGKQIYAVEQDHLSMTFPFFRV